jgi:polysaccharide deacetylase 2 family uncharacterized protein YibQ
MRISERILKREHKAIIEKLEELNACKTRHGYSTNLDKEREEQIAQLNAWARELEHDLIYLEGVTKMLNTSSEDWRLNSK